ncbi:hypothetical protein DFS34DRAFT_648121 [Phlyctochytrium arcticum]|nr:hypothetical protein DFS34DRAFT_648121 [Phlyctochytrium arcticum]
MISGPELDRLYDILARETTTLEAKALSFRTAAAGEREKLTSIAVSLTILLSQKVLLPLPQLRISALFILADISTTLDSPNDPYTASFLDFVSPDPRTSTLTFAQSSMLAITDAERYIAIRLLLDLRGAIQEFAGTTAQTLLVSLNSSHLQSITTSTEALSALDKCKEDARILGHSSIIPSLSTISSEKSATSRLEDPTLEEAKDASKELFRILTDSEGQFFLNPPLFTPSPPILPPRPDEMIWLSPPEIIHQIQWDYSIGPDIASKDQVQRLFSLALKGSLSHAQQHVVVSSLSNEPALLDVCNIQPSHLPDLVEKNLSIAVAALLILMNTPRQQEFLKIFVTITMSLHSLEVVNRLATTVTSPLPPEFLHMYIIHCIATCEGIKDRYMQNRQVRLVCVFLQSLIRQKTISIPDFFVEIQAFCIQFSRIREAAGLFRLLKKENEGGEQT